MIYTGKGWYPDSPKADEDKITQAIIRNNGKEIVIDYEYHNKRLFIELTSSDGVDFEGKYGEFGKKVGSCSFTLWKNKRGYFLFGGYTDPEGGNGSWCMQLEPKVEKVV